MFKKIIIPVLAVLAFTTMAFYRNSDVFSEEPNRVTMGKYEPVVVLELFTSQGCSSCPPADVLLDKAKKDYPDRVFALSYHVDYWDYIGWKDPFGKSIHSKKQGYYNRKFRSKSNYTPQMVVNGKEHFVGSNNAKLQAKVNSYGQQKALNAIQLSNVVKNGRDISFDYTVLGDTANTQLHVVLVLNERTTTVKRGENRSRVLKNSNIVIAEKYQPLQIESKSASIKIPAMATTSDKLTLMVFTENDILDITGATKTKV
ncbi:DUF1223 domain-containing protein [uncultured Croceitalea sp.]|uniref:DUF1223 domain-containing protein n=1 Tax=uncultured Croceitalea sp. TaxID=1798908 RepID=UPI003305B843